jgi:hypothetical protein
MLIDHDHPPGRFDAGHCWACAHQAGMLDHYDRVQDQEANLRQAREWAWAAHRYAIWALGSSAIGVLLARPPSSPDEPAPTGLATRRKLTSGLGVRLAADTELSASGRRRQRPPFVPSSCV